MTRNQFHALCQEPCINMKVFFWIDSHKYSLGKVGSQLMRLIMRKFEEQGISMPDDAREMIFPDGISVRLDQGDGNVQKARTISSVGDSGGPSVVPPASDTTRDGDHEGEDLESDAADIQKQAEQSRDPEEGANIL